MQLALASSKLNHQPRSSIKFINRGEGCTKKLVFVHFVLTNKFPNNVFLSDKLEAYVCVDIIVNGRVVHIKARKFLALDNAFERPEPTTTVASALRLQNYGRLKSWKNIWLFP
jgi:hypothetical protein